MPVRPVEAAPFERDGYGGIDLTDLFLPALRTDGHWPVGEGTDFGEVIAAVFATVMVSWHAFLFPVLSCVPEKRY